MSHPIRSFLFTTLPILLLAGCSQNPHVDISNPPAAKTSAAAAETPRGTNVTPPLPSDRDHDGVLDNVDKCPDVPGPADNNGCPYPEWQDTDHDGTPDADDDCPTVPGPVENNGCPYDGNDRDHDFVPDDADKCPDVPGQVFNDGCPIGHHPVDGDYDGDGVPDRLDKCPYEKGLIFNDGCPLREKDTDRDGIPDSKDACPREPGCYCNHGCPFPREEERKVLLEVYESLKFDFDRATIKNSSFPALNRLGAFMEKYPGSHLRMVGHTDDVGTDEYNMSLSEARVSAVKEFLVTHGISQHRISTDFRGERQPLVSTRGLEGESLERARAKNRRVDMSIRYETTQRVR